MTDSIADMLTRIRNGYAVGLAEVAVPYSRMKEELAKLLSSRGLVAAVSTDKEKRSITISLAYTDGRPALTSIRRVSRPGLRVYEKARNIRRVRRGMGTVIVSTSQGLMMGEEARKNKLGGEVLAEVY